MKRRLVRGGVAGTVATALMSGLMLAARQAGWLGRMPPEKITTRLLRRSGFRPNRGERNLAAAVAHAGFGAAGGMAFAVLPRRPRPLPLAIGLGMAYGTAIWAVSYLGWVPALGLMAPADRDRPGRPQSMLVAHWLYGASLALLVR